METYSTTDIIKFLKEKEINFFSLADFGRLFNIANRNTLYKKIQRLEEKQLIKRIIKGKYRFLLGSANDFVLANYFCHPSYISLESALSFYGIITGFSYKITSLTTKKSRSFDIDKKEFCYSQINKNFFWGYEKKDNFLIADKEKALLDYIYFSLKGLRDLDWKEIELNEIDKSKLINYGRRLKNKKLLKIIKERIR